MVAHSLIARSSITRIQGGGAPIEVLDDRGPSFGSMSKTYNRPAKQSYVPERFLATAFFVATFLVAAGFGWIEGLRVRRSAAMRSLTA